MAKRVASARAEWGTKYCTACGRQKQLVGFWRRGIEHDGRDRWCRDCRRRYMQRWIAGHRAAHRAWHRRYRKEHRNQLREYNREYQRRRRALMRAGKWPHGVA